MKLPIKIWLVFTVLLATSRMGFAQGTALTLDVDGVTRQALIFAPPAGTGGEKRPVIFGFHGHGGNMNGASRMMHFQDLWPEAIVVYPQGLPSPSPRDPSGLRPGWQNEPGTMGDRDLKFVDAMLVTLKKNYSVDDARIYSAGFSNGAGFSYALWAKRSKTFAAFGICAGAMFPATQLSDPKPVIVIAGETDKVLPFSKQQEALVAARQIDQATGIGQSCGPFCTLFSSTVSAPVMAILHPGGHVFTPRAAESIVNFFKGQKL